MGGPNARSMALSVLDLVRSKNMLATAALRRETQRHDPEPKIAATANALSLGVLRYRARLDHFLEAAADRGLPQKDQRLLDILRLGAYELLFVERSRPYATVSSVVELAKAVKGKRIGGFVNAILRKLSKLYPGDVEKTMSGMQVSVRLSFPDWIVEEARAAFGAGAAAELESLNQPSDIAVRVNTAKTTTQELEGELKRLGFQPRRVPFLPSALVLPPDEPPYRSVPFVRGLFRPQDISSQLVSQLAAAVAGERVLDACAGNGTKTLALLEDGPPERTIVATDLSGKRIATLQERCATYGITGVETAVADLTAPPFPPQSFDLVFVDAPCSGLGTIRRHPELKWRRTPEDVAANARLQARLLAGAAGLVKPGGKLVYAVCTFTLAEGPQLVERFLASHPEFSRSSLDLHDEQPLTPQRDLLVFPTQYYSDCFYAAKLVRV